MTRILAVLFALLVTFTASAQVVQPVYVRPAKGSQVQVFSSATTDRTSAVYDMSVYNGAQFVLDFDPTCEATVRIYGGLTKSGPFLDLILSDPYSFVYTFSVGFSPFQYTSLTATPYIQIQLDIIGGCDVSGVSLSMVPSPFPSQTGIRGLDKSNSIPSDVFPVIIGGISPDSGFVKSADVTDDGELVTVTRSDFLTPVTSPLTINTTTTQFVTAASKYRSMVIQNVGTVAVKCGVNATLTNYSFILKGGSVAEDGTGGIITVGGKSSVPLLVGDFSCISVGPGTSKVSIGIY